MIRCKLSTMMGERRLKISDVSRKSGIHRNIVARYYRNNMGLLSKDVLNRLCKSLGCTVGDLLEYVPDEGRD